MTAQIQIPDELYERAEKFATERDLSLEEITRRGLELYLNGSSKELKQSSWQLPLIDGGGVTVPLEKLKDFVFEDQQSQPEAK
jgi:hypothetical protein